jgi:radical SAM superfamily enzyme YgiQ (UPF0313 family)
MAAYVARLNADTEAYYITTRRYRSIMNAIMGTRGAGGEVPAEEIDQMAHGLLGADVVGFSSMTGYAHITHRLSKRVRELDPSIYQIWGGIHPIIHPEDAITAPVDAICVGEGEFAFEEWLQKYSEGRDATDVKNFWFKSGEEIKRNHFLPLMSSQEMETLPHPLYREKEWVYRHDVGFTRSKLEDYVANDGVSYTAIWSIGCPFHCTYCGNTKFIANDKSYKRIRHPSAQYMVDEIKAVRERSPHVNHVSFQDDSFMAIPYPQLEEFAERWKAELDIPFAVYGVIPNYVKQDKFEILTWAGMDRIRMGVQSGSERILEFYKRPSPPKKILAAGEVFKNFAGTYHMPPIFDIIMDNPIETRQDVVDTLELLYAMPRPFTLLIYSLKVIPNTELERAMKEAGIDLDMINETFLLIPPRWGNLMLYVLCCWRPPRWLWNRLLTRVRASTEEQKLYPRLAIVLRTAYLTKRMIPHLKAMEFSIMPGWVGYVAWRVGLTGLWRKRFHKRHPKPARPEKWVERDKSAVSPVVAVLQEPASDVSSPAG